MVLDISSLLFTEAKIASKLLKKILRSFAHNIDEYIEPASVSHSETNSLHRVLTRMLNQNVQERNKRITPL